MKEEVIGTQKSKITWLAVLQGFAMLSVVLGHSHLYSRGDPKENIIISGLIDIIYQFHMPLMFMISGYLYYYTCLKKGKKYKKIISQKLTRLGVPFIVFSFITVLPKMLFSSLMNRPVNSNFGGLILDVFVYGNNPLAEMWFIYTLLLIMLLYPVYKVVLKNRIFEIAFFVIALFLATNWRSTLDFKYFYIPTFTRSLVYFFVGVILSKYSLIDRVNSFKSWIYIIIPLCLFNIFQISFPMRAILDSLFCFAVCRCVGDIFPNLFISFRNYTFQIYLMGIFFQMPIRYIWWGAGKNEYLYFILWIINISLALYMPVLISRFVEKINLRYIKLALGLKTN